MELLTQEEILALLQHRFINFAAVAEVCFPDDPDAKQKLWGRVYSSRIKEISHDTRERVTMAFAELWALMNKNQIL
jgi:hypothetical protein